MAFATNHTRIEWSIDVTTAARACVTSVIACVAPSIKHVTNASTRIRFPVLCVCVAVAVAVSVS